MAIAILTPSGPLKVVSIIKNIVAYTKEAV